MLLENIENAWYQQASRGISEMMQRFPDEQFYAAAFHLFYADYTVFGAPALGMNSESAVVFHPANSTSGIIHEPWDTRWVAPEWRWPVLDSVCTEINPLYQALSESLQGASRAEWEKLFRQHEDLLANVARRITAEARTQNGNFQGIHVSKDFVLAILEGQDSFEEYNRLVRLSVDPAILPTLEGIIIFD